MRIVGGMWRGRKLDAPEGLGTRPTSDRAREAIFNILTHASWMHDSGIEGKHVLDIFSGTGALALEALSREAAHAVMVEKDKQAIAACKKNIAGCKAENATMILPANALHPPLLPAGVPPRNLVFCDPPYGGTMGVDAVTAFDRANWLDQDCVVVMEMAKKQQEPPLPGFILADERSYGVALVRFMIRTR